MRTQLIVLALIISGFAAPLPAQETGDEPVTEAAELAKDACEPVGEGAVEAEVGEDEADGASTEDECEQAGEDLADDLTEIELPTGMGDIVEEDPAVRASADDVFEPGEEISEDFPVPLPSDI